MKPTLIIPLLILLAIACSCGIMPQLASEAENIIDDDAIKITVSREALGRQTNVVAHVELDNGQVQQVSK
jgi:hypothetical protein